MKVGLLFNFFLGIVLSFTNIENYLCDQTYNKTKINQISALKVDIIIDGSVINKIQTFHVDTSTYIIKYKTSNKKIVVDIVNDKFLKTSLSRPQLNQYSYIDSKFSYIICKNTLSDKTFQYRVISVDVVSNPQVLALGNATSTTLDKQMNDISSFLLTKIIQIDLTNNKVYVILQSTTSFLYYFDLNDLSKLVRVAQIANVLTNIQGGNVYQLYCSLTKKFYSLTNTTGVQVYNQVDPTVLTAGASFYSNVKIFNFLDSATVFYSFSDDNMSFTAFGSARTSTGIGAAQAIISMSGTSQFKILSDNTHHLIIKKQTQVIWYFYQGFGLIYGQKLSSSSLTTLQKTQMLTDFSKSIQISGNSLGIYLLTNDSFTQYIQTVDSVNSSLLSFDKLYQVTLSNDLMVYMQVDGNFQIRTNLVCNCLKNQIVRVTCFSSTLKCINTVKTVAVDCTVPAT